MKGLKLLAKGNIECSEREEVGEEEGRGWREKGEERRI